MTSGAQLTTTNSRRSPLLHVLASRIDEDTNSALVIESLAGKGSAALVKEGAC